MMLSAIVSMLLLLVVGVIAGPALAPSNGKGTRGLPRRTATSSYRTGVYGETVSASPNPGGDGAYVLARCWLTDGTYVFAAYYPVVDNKAAVGPLAATTWRNARATCIGEEGYFMRDGWGKWVTLATDTFEVGPS
jgi:hypothetical protein